jgi:hypothetical protein
MGICSAIGSTNEDSVARWFCCKGEVSVAEKALGVWSAVDRDNSMHLSQNITDHMNEWISKMKNCHLPDRLGWIVYKFKL